MWCTCRMQLQQIVELWNQFFHAPVTCAPLVLFRLLLGVILIGNAILLLPLLTEFYSVHGVWSYAAWQAQQKRSRLCLLHLLPATDGSVRCLWFLHFASCVGFLAGFEFRACCVCGFVTLASLHHRNNFILSSGDTLLRLFLFMFVFSEAHAAMSVDAWRTGRNPFQFPDMDPWPMRLMQIQVCIVYVRSVFWKLRGKSWWNGTAAWFPLWVDAFMRWRPPRWMLHPWLVRIATWGTLLEEATLGSLIWVREFRYPALFSGILMHRILETIMNLQFFGWIMIAALLLFLLPDDAEWLLQRFSR